MYVFDDVCKCVYAYIHIYRYINELCARVNYGRSSEPQHTQTTASVNECIEMFHVMLFISYIVHVMHRLSYTSP